MPEDFSSQSGIFRTPIVEASSSTPSSVETNRVESISSVDVEPGITEYEQIRGIPFTVSFLGLINEYPHLDQSDRDSIKVINDYLVSKVKSGEFIDSSDSGKGILNKLMDKLGLDSTHSSYYKIDKLSEVLKIIDPLKEEEPKSQIQRVQKIQQPKVQVIFPKIDRSIFEMQKQSLKLQNISFQQTLRSMKEQQSKMISIAKKEAKLNATKSALNKLLKAL